jgi:Tfp pilus assembly protein PilO
MNITLNGLKKIGLKERIIMNFAFFFFLTIGMAYFVVIPTIDDILKMNKEIEAERIDLENKYLKSKNLKKLSANFKKIEAQAEKLDQIFISPNRALEFITTMEEAANRNEISQKINLAGTQNAEDGQTYKKIPLQIMVNGNFIKQLEYLADLETLKYYLNIKSLEFSAPLPAVGQNKDGASKDETASFISADTYWK